MYRFCIIAIPANPLYIQTRSLGRNFFKSYDSLKTRHTTEVLHSAFNCLSHDNLNEPKLPSIACLVPILLQFPLDGGGGRNCIDAVRGQNISGFQIERILINAITYDPGTIQMSNYTHFARADLLN